MKFEKVIKLLKTYNIIFDVLTDNYLRVYYPESIDYTMLEITEFGDISIQGRIQDLEKWILRVKGL